MFRLKSASATDGLTPDCVLAAPSLPTVASENRPAVGVSATVTIGTNELKSDNNKLAYTGHKFLIGKGRDRYTALRSGFLLGLANDWLPRYADNSGVVTLTAERIEQGVA